jgi:hypothetical protein
MLRKQRKKKNTQIFSFILHLQIFRKEYIFAYYTIYVSEKQSKTAHSMKRTKKRVREGKKSSSLSLIY